jgi:hemolysin III
MEQYRREEIANSITHGLGTLLALIAAGSLVASTWNLGNRTLAMACTAYGVALVAVFFCSTMSHWIRTESWRARFRALDQGFIYLLIVATYTPFSIVYLTERRWWLILAAMWTIALAGFVSKVFWSHRVNRVSILMYLVLGWMPVLGGWPASAAVPVGAIIGILAGGAAYTAGTWFLVHDDRAWYLHAIWHLFVIGAAAIHYGTTMTWVIPPAS